jgi:hypothetical protein
MLNILTQASCKSNFIHLKNQVMIAKTFSVLFRLKKPAHYKRGPQPIYLRIMVDGKRTILSAQRDCEPSKWNTALGRANGTKKDIKILNAYLDGLQRKAYEVHQALLDAMEVVTAEKIKTVIRYCRSASRDPGDLPGSQRSNEDLLEMAMHPLPINGTPLL